MPNLVSEKSFKKTSVKKRGTMVLAHSLGETFNSIPRHITPSVTCGQNDSAESDGAAALARTTRRKEQRRSKRTKTFAVVHAHTRAASAIVLL